MRGIKFRAWHHGGGDPRVEGRMNYSYPFPVKFWDNVENEPLDVEVMQYTGLKDKNGKEIYEGDIVNVLNYLNGEVWQGHTHYDEVVFVEGRFNIKSPWRGESLQANTVEVIGNIYENPELLES